MTHLERLLDEFLDEGLWGVDDPYPKAVLEHAQHSRKDGQVEGPGGSSHCHCFSRLALQSRVGANALLFFYYGDENGPQILGGAAISMVIHFCSDIWRGYTPPAQNTQIHAVTYAPTLLCLHSNTNSPHCKFFSSNFAHASCDFSRCFVKQQTTVVVLVWCVE